MPDIQHSVTPKTSRKTWARDTGWLLGANVSKTAGLLLFLVVLARLTNTEIVGEYALALAITAPVFVFAQFGLKGIFLTHKVVFPFGTYLWVQLIGATAATLVSVCIGLPADSCQDARVSFFVDSSEDARVAGRIFLRLR